MAASEASSGPVSRGRVAGWLGLAGLALWLVAAALDLAAVSGLPYVQDGRHATQRNRVVQRFDVGEIFTSNYWEGTIVPDRSLYRPVTVLTFAAEVRATGGPSPRASHRVNLVLQIGVAILLAAWAARVGARREVALFAGLLFLAHPATHMTAVNVVGRADQLALGFTLAALLLALRAGPEPGRAAPGPVARRIAAWAAGACVFLAAGSKEVGVAAAALVVAQEALLRPAPRDRASWLERAGVAVPAVTGLSVYLALRTVALESFPGIQQVLRRDNVLAGLDGVERLATTLAMAGRYVALAFWPAALSPDYSGAAVPAAGSLAAPHALLGLVAGSALLALLVAPLARSRRDGRGRARLALFAALVLVPYAIVGNVLVLNSAGFAVRLLYYPAAGVALLAAELAGRLARSLRVPRPGLPALGLALLLARAVFGDVSMWTSDEALHRRALEVAPGALRSRLFLAERYLAEGRLAESRALYEAAVRDAPYDGASWTGLGIASLAGGGSPDRAEAALERARTLLPHEAEVHYWLGAARARTGRLDEAERSMRKALVLFPGLIDARELLAELLARDGRYGEAAEHFAVLVDLGREDLRPKLLEARRLAQPVPPGR